MANEEYVERLKRSVEEWNSWREEHPEIQPDLSETNLRETNLSLANLSQADLYEANLCEANLCQASLNKAKLVGADLWKTNLSGADLAGSDLSGANLTSATLKWTNLSKAELSKVNFDQARFSTTLFAWVDLSNVQTLETAVHQGPSSVDINSVTLPHDESTRNHFLQGVGFSDALINYLSSRPIARIQYMSCFISYAKLDEALAKRLHKDLQKNDVRCWFAPEDMKIGDKIHTRIDEAIHTHEKLLLILSEHSITSTWVEKEVETALEREARDKCLMLFPVKLDETVMQTDQAWAADTRRMRHIGDFTNWQDDAAYQEAFSRLLRDLKVSKPTG